MIDITYINQEKKIITSSNLLKNGPFGLTRNSRSFPTECKACRINFTPKQIRVHQKYAYERNYYHLSCFLKKASRRMYTNEFYIDFKSKPANFNKILDKCCLYYWMQTITCTEIKKPLDKLYRYELYNELTLRNQKGLSRLNKNELLQKLKQLLDSPELIYYTKRRNTCVYKFCKDFESHHKYFFVPTEIICLLQRFLPIEFGLIDDQLQMKNKYKKLSRQRANLGEQMIIIEKDCII